MIDFDCETEKFEFEYPVSKTVRFCINKLIQDKTKRLNEEVVNDLIYEELLGALLQAKDLIDTIEEKINV